MPANKPFLANLLVAFRGYNTTAKPSQPTNTPPSPPRRPAGTQPSPTSQIATAAAAAAAAGGSSNGTTTQQMPIATRRRSSSSTREGFQPSSAEKWWIGGKNSEGQERFYRLQPVRQRSYDRLSIDRVSL